MTEAVSISGGQPDAGAFRFGRTAPGEAPPLFNDPVRADPDPEPPTVAGLCLLFPRPPEEQIAEMRRSIKAEGLLVPLLRFRGEIWDGKVRLEICLSEGLPLRFEDLPDDTPIQDVVSRVFALNLARRHLQKAQVAMLLAMQLRDLRAKAEGQGAKLPRSGWVERLAKQNGISRRLFIDARAVGRDGTPESQRAVAAGEQPLAPAAREARASRSGRATRARELGISLFGEGGGTPCTASTVRAGRTLRDNLEQWVNSAENLSPEDVAEFGPDIERYTLRIHEKVSRSRNAHARAVNRLSHEARIRAETQKLRDAVQGGSGVDERNVELLDAAIADLTRNLADEHEAREAERRRTRMSVADQRAPAVPPPAAEPPALPAPDVPAAAAE